MVESNEVIALIVGLLFFIYLLLVLKQYNITIELPWLGALIAILLSDVCTVAEGFVFPVFFNFAEHLLFTISTVFLFFGIFGLITKRNIHD